MINDTHITIPGLCGFCGMIHNTPTCPMVEEIEYFPDGRIKRYKLREFARGGPEVRVIQRIVEPDEQP